MKKVVFYWLIITSLAFALCYAVGVFASATFDLTAWSKNLRHFLGITAGGLSILGALVTVQLNSDNDADYSDIET